MTARTISASAANTLSAGHQIDDALGPVEAAGVERLLRGVEAPIVGVGSQQHAKLQQRRARFRGKALRRIVPRRACRRSISDWVMIFRQEDQPAAGCAFVASSGASSGGLAARRAARKFALDVGRARREFRDDAVIAARFIGAAKPMLHQGGAIDRMRRRAPR